MRTTIELPDHILKQAKIKAVEEGISLKKLFIRALERELHSADSIDSSEQTSSGLKTSFRSSLKTGKIGEITASKSVFLNIKTSKK